jgi:hypothetical protein
VAAGFCHVRKEIDGRTLREEMIPMGYIVKAPGEWFLKGTQWTNMKEAAAEFDTEEQAKAAIAEAAKSSKPNIVKGWAVVQA